MAETEPPHRVMGAGMSLWHGSAQRQWQPAAAPLWVSDSRAAAAYGDFVHRLTARRALRLLDVSQPLFHQHFMGQLNRLYRGASGRSGGDPRKPTALAPLGLLDVETTRRMLAPVPGATYERPGDDDADGQEQYDQIMQAVGSFGGHHRYSSEQPDGSNPDHAMVQAMRVAYPGYDGYACPVSWPSVHMGGFLPPEVCIFDAVASLTYGGLYREPPCSGAGCWRRRRRCGPSGPRALRGRGALRGAPGRPGTRTAGWCCRGGRARTG